MTDEPTAVAEARAIVMRHVMPRQAIGASANIAVDRLIAAAHAETAAEVTRLRALNTRLVEALEDTALALESWCTCNASLAEEVLEGTGIHPWECECPEPWAQTLITATKAALAATREEA